MHCITGHAPFVLHSHYYLPELARIKSYLQSTSTEKYLEKHNKKLRPETSRERSLEHIAQQLMLAQNLTLQLRIQSPPNHNVKTQVLIHRVHCIIGRALLMLHRHNLYLNSLLEREARRRSTMGKKIW